MEIISLRDDCPDAVSRAPGRHPAVAGVDPILAPRRRKDPSNSVSGNHLKITNIKPQVKNENRVSIFINGKYDFSLDIAQVVDFKLKVGQVLTSTELEKYRKASAYGKLYQRTLEWTLTRPHSVREVNDYLFRRKAEEEDRKKIVETLTQKGYLDDEAFARFYVENRFVKKGISKKRLQLELIKKGVEKNIIEEVLAENLRSDEEEIKKIILKKAKKYTPEKLVTYLTRQGFDYQLAKDLVLEQDELLGTD